MIHPPHNAEKSVVTQAVRGRENSWLAAPVNGGSTIVEWRKPGEAAPSGVGYHGSIDHTCLRRYRGRPSEFGA